MNEDITLAALQESLASCKRMIAALSPGHDRQRYEDHAAELKTRIEEQEQWEKQDGAHK
jgi:hypothetical protein